MRQTFSLGNPARVARRQNLRRREAWRRMPSPLPPGPPKPDPGPLQAGEMDWLTPVDEGETEALRRAWSFVE